MDSVDCDKIPMFISFGLCPIEARRSLGCALAYFLLVSITTHRWVKVIPNLGPVDDLSMLFVTN
jgi:hypothetical protein